MTPHDRYQAFMRFQPVDRPPLLEWPPWDSTVRAWMTETGKDRDYVLQYIRECDPSESTGIDFGMLPPFPEVVIAEDADTITKQDALGKVYRLPKANPDTTWGEKN